jgi:HEPN domain-containing protein
MKNKTLADDYLTRSEKRLKAIDTLFHEASWPDVVRESQEAVELSLKALLRKINVEVPRIHDVSNILQENKSKLPKAARSQLDALCKISKELRRDRELAFYGSEDLTPLEFYTKHDAERARAQAKTLVQEVRGFWKLIGD